MTQTVTGSGNWSVVMASFSPSGVVSTKSAFFAFFA
jgi:hypothetical protein